jgi:acetyltransferase-like isoleucine patch superfamily enzyme
MFTNDKFIDRKLSKDFLPTKLGNKVYVGSNSSILPVSICDDVVIGAGSVVTKDITEPGTYVGNPARKLK